MATRCFWPPERRAGYSSRFSDRPTLARYFSAVAIAWSPPDSHDPDRCLDEVVDHLHVGEEVELLEDHLGAHPDLPDLLPVVAAPGVERVGVDPEAVDLDGAGSRLLEEVETAQERALARARAPDDADRLAGVDLEGAAAQDVVGPEVLLDRERAHDRL